MKVLLYAAILLGVGIIALSCLGSFVLIVQLCNGAPWWASLFLILYAGWCAVGIGFTSFAVYELKERRCA